MWYEFLIYFPTYTHSCGLDFVQDETSICIPLRTVYVWGMLSDHIQIIGNTKPNVAQLLGCCILFSSAPALPVWSFQSAIIMSFVSWAKYCGISKANIALCFELGNKPLWYCRTNSERLQWEHCTAKAYIAANSCSAGKFFTQRAGMH